MLRCADWRNNARHGFVYDNVTAPDHIADLLPSAGARVLITSRFSTYSASGVAGGSSDLSAVGRGSSQMRLSSETKSMDFLVEGRRHSSALLRPLPSVSTVEGLQGRLLAAARPFSSICLCRTFSTALLQAL
jgi:hypothetical protein